MMERATMQKTGVIGLGNMGRGMAASLMRAGFHVLGYDPCVGDQLVVEERSIALTSSLSEIA